MTLRVLKADTRLMWTRNFPAPIQRVLHPLWAVSCRHGARDLNLSPHQARSFSLSRLHCFCKSQEKSVALCVGCSWELEGLSPLFLPSSTVFSPEKLLSV